MSKEEKKAAALAIAGCLFVLGGLLWVIAGNIPIGMMNVCIGVMFAVLGRMAARRSKKDQPPPVHDGQPENKNVL